MATQAIPAGPPRLLGVVSSWLGSLANSDPDDFPVTPDETRARRDFVHEMLDRGGAAIASETDIQTMMLVYPCRF